jgi:hypothetical protein
MVIKFKLHYFARRFVNVTNTLVATGQQHFGTRFRRLHFFRYNAQSQAAFAGVFKT